MSLDGPYDDRTSDGRPERHLRSGAPDAGPAEARAEPAEPRTRAEYYEALRAADEESAQVDESAQGPRMEHSGWDTADTKDRPAPDAIHISTDRSTHILDGDARGGGHRHGTGKPGKTEFPASWDDVKIISALLDVARRPDQALGFQEWNGRWVARGTRDDVEIVVVIARDGRIWSGWPLPGGSGVVKNPEGT